MSVLLAVVEEGSLSAGARRLRAPPGRAHPWLGRVRRNRQYVSAGNTAADDGVAPIFMDYPHQRLLKLLGRLQAQEPGERPDLAERFAVPSCRARVERVVTPSVKACDWNCPQHITPRFTAAEIEAAVAPLHARIAVLEARLAERTAETV